MVRGACFGSAIGDAAGAVLEFLGRRVTVEDVDRALALAGGGRWRTLPGQVTDDTELALALAAALKDKDPLLGFPVDAVAASYAAWRRSDPFDMGRTCDVAFVNPTADTMMEMALKWSSESQANGALMRLVPLAVWARKLDPERVAEMAMADARLSHPNIACQECNAAYAVALAHLINQPGDAEGAVEKAERWLAVHGSASPAKTWIHETEFENVGKRNVGWVRHAFSLAFYHLRQRTPFTEALRHTLLLGGDTDTNAAIVGGLVGALHGVGGIPTEMIDTVVACRPSSRPPKYWVSAYEGFFQALEDQVPWEHIRPLFGTVKEIEWDGETLEFRVEEKLVNLHYSVCGTAPHPLRDKKVYYVANIPWGQGYHSTLYVDKNGEFVVEDTG